MNRSPMQRLARAALIGIPLLAAPLVPEAAPLGMLSLAALIAYDGVVRHTVWYIFLFLLALELLFGFDIGAFTLPYLIGLALWKALQHIVALAPWANVDGWHASDMARAAGSAAVLWAVMMFAAVAVEAVIYAHSAFAGRFLLALGTVPWEFLVFYGVFVLILLHRIDVSFRERIHFGT